MISGWKEGLSPEGQYQQSSGRSPCSSTLAAKSAVISGASATDAAEVAPEGLEPPGDLNASPEYRCHLARVLTRRGLEQASR